jgi:hypothetical protein
MTGMPKRAMALRGGSTPAKAGDAVPDVVFKCRVRDDKVPAPPPPRAAAPHATRPRWCRGAAPAGRDAGGTDAHLWRRVNVRAISAFGSLFPFNTHTHTHTHTHKRLCTCALSRFLSLSPCANGARTHRL